jgi:3-phenylpropionate/trans-cinnamate dioxygenase ferredoxin reductase subunit
MGEDRTFLVVGAGLAGARAVEALRERGFGGRLVLVGDEPHLPYDRPPLSKGYLKTGEGLKEAFLHPQDWYAARDVELRLGAAVTAIDRAAREVVIDGGERLGYERLLLATGSSPRRLRIPGADRPGVLYLRTIEDSDRLREAFRPGARVVFVGAGWIGLEAASAAREAGADVTVLEALDRPLGQVLPPELSEVFARLHREHGVDLRTGAQVAAVEAEGDRLTCVRLHDGELVPAEVVVLGVGAVPNTALAEEAGLEVDDGILVDEQCRTSDPDVFAAGDVASQAHPFLGTRVRVEHWANALNQPAAAAGAMLGGDDVYDELPFFYTDQYDLGMEYTGRGSPGDEVVVRGDLAAREFIACWLDAGGRLTAGMNVNVWDITEDLKALIRSRAVVDRARLADPDTPLADLRP